MKPSSWIFTPLLLAGPSACVGPTNLSQDGTSTLDDDTAWVEPLFQTTAIVTTVSSDFAVGSFAALSLDDQSVEDNLFVTSGDPAVSVSSGRVFQYNRYTYDTLRMYRPGRWATPVWEQELGDRANPHDARVCGEHLFVSLYGRDYIGVYALADGDMTGTVDLSAYADGDDVGPEPSSMVALDGKLYAGLQRLMRHEGWTDAGSQIVEIDCDTLEVSRDWPVGANLLLSDWPDRDQLLVATEAFDQDPSGVYALNPIEGSVTLLAEAPEIQITGIAAHGDRAIGIGLASDLSHHDILCVDLSTGASTLMERTERYLTDITSNDRGEAWLAARPSWVDPSAATGLSVYSIETCELLSEEPTLLTLHPFDIAFY